MRIWFTQWKDSHMIRDTVVEDLTGETRTHKIFAALDKACREFDLAVPIWLDKTVKDFRRTGRARFAADSFIEEIGFDYMEIRVIEED